MNRLKTIDFMRGLVMVIMALDHTRDLMHVDALTKDPANLADTTVWLFGTRWITHLCAPTFVFLSGISAYLSFQNQGNFAESRRFLLTRGLWLVFLEFTVVNFGIWFNIHFEILMLQVIGAIGFSMIILSFLLKLSPRTIGIIGLFIVIGHVASQLVNFPEGTASNFIWGTLFRLSFFQISPKFIFFVNYPIIPWAGILLTGFGFGQYLQKNSLSRGKILAYSGLGVLTIFLILRSFNLYGDPANWTVQKNTLFTLLSIINVTKYPPSLLFTLLMIGISLIIMSFAEGKDNRLTRFFSVYGKVPLFYYVIHWYILHGLMLVLMLFQSFHWSELNFAPFGFGRPKQGGGVELGWIYLIWISVVLILYPLCRWFGSYKANRRDKKWLRYL